MSIKEIFKRLYFAIINEKYLGTGMCKKHQKFNLYDNLYDMYKMYDPDVFTRNLEVLYLENYNIDEWGELNYKYSTDSGFDVRAAIDESIFVYQNKPVLINTGVKFGIPKGYEVVIRPRSGLGSKGIMCCFGTIDENYRGEVKVTLYNFSEEMFLISPGDRIAQCVLQKKSKCKLLRVNNFENETDRGEKGFGSTGNK